MLGKRTFGASTGIAKRARTSAYRQVAAASRTARILSGRYNRRMSVRGAGRVSGETGFLDVATATYAFDTTGSVTLLNTVPQGASVSQRVGKKIVLTSLQVRGNTFNNSAALWNDVAMLIVYDRRPTGALPAITDILNSVSSVSMNNDANSGRFVIVKRSDFVMIGNTTAAANISESAVVDASAYIPLGNKPTVYKAAATGAIGDIEQGALYLVTVGAVAAGTTAASAQLAFRLRFKDI